LRWRLRSAFAASPIEEIERYSASNHVLIAHAASTRASATNKRP
jgi:hypothetical protein